MKTVYTGLESSGKTLKMAMKAVEVLERNIKWKEQSGITRPIMANMQFSEEFHMVAKNNGIPIHIFQHTYEFPMMRNCDIFIDEIGTYFDSRLWADLPLDVRRWTAQSTKLGCEIYGAAQDFAQVDLSFRRLVNNLFLIQKIAGSRRPSATKPPVKHIWGLCLAWQLDPRNYEEDNKKVIEFIPNAFFIEKKYCGIFNTLQEIAMSDAPPLRKIVRVCPEDGYTKVKYV